MTEEVSSLRRGLVSGEVLFKLTSALDVEASEVLLVGLVDRGGTEDVEYEAATEVEGHWVLSAVVPQALNA